MYAQINIELSPTGRRLIDGNISTRVFLLFVLQAKPFIRIRYRVDTISIVYVFILRSRTIIAMVYSRGTHIVSYFIIFFFDFEEYNF